jgi:predicted metal-dependent HD superfamily phosphohydrolase
VNTNGGQRVALFCQAYKHKYGSSYMVSGKEGAMLKKLSIKTDVDFEKLVTAYLECSEWWAQPKSIGGMLSRINELRQWVCAPKADTKAPWHFPDGYSKTREQECKTNEEIQAYWRHLRDLGYKRTRVGIVETWKRVTSNQENI